MIQRRVSCSLLSFNIHIHKSVYQMLIESFGWSFEWKIGLFVWLVFISACKGYISVTMHFFSTFYIGSYLHTLPQHKELFQWGHSPQSSAGCQHSSWMASALTSCFKGKCKQSCCFRNKNLNIYVKIIFD